MSSARIVRKDRTDVMQLFKHSAAARKGAACEVSTLSSTARPYRALDLTGQLLDAENCIDFIHKARGTAVAWYRRNILFFQHFIWWRDGRGSSAPWIHQA
jgi:hypothetical protein